MQTIGLKVLEWMLPVVLGPLVYYVARELLNVSRAVDNLPPLLKRVVVMGIGTLVTAVFAALQVALPGECAALTSGDAAAGATQACFVALSAKVPVQGVTAALVAMVVHAIKKQRPHD